VWFFALLLIPSLALADINDDSTDNIGPGFVEVQGGWYRIQGSGRTNLDDCALVVLSTGFSLTKEFRSEGDYAPLKVGPKISAGFGRNKLTHKEDVFYNLILNTRFSFGDRGAVFLPFLEGGPGITRYGNTGFELEGGAGIRFLFGTGTFGLHGGYLHVFGSSAYSQAMELLLSLGYQF